MSKHTAPLSDKRRTSQRTNALAKNNTRPQTPIRRLRLSASPKLNQEEFAIRVLELGPGNQALVSRLENGLMPTADQIEKMEKFADETGLNWRFPSQVVMRAKGV